MNADPWELTLAVALVVNAVLGLSYRIYRAARGGPRADVVGQALLGALLLIVAGFAMSGAGWPRWVALAYGLLFGVIVMPVWLLAVLIPLPPRAGDWAFTVIYWAGLALIVVAALLA